MLLREPFGCIGTRTFEQPLPLFWRRGRATMPADKTAKLDGFPFQNGRARRSSHGSITRQGRMDT
jgi:hypothetical protein